MNACIYIYIFTHKHTHTYIHINTNTYTYKYIYIHTVYTVYICTKDSLQANILYRKLYIVSIITYCLISNCGTITLKLMTSRHEMLYFHLDKSINQTKLS